jgi:hypothetical protein
MDVPTSCRQTRALLNREPTQPGPIADLGRPRYFQT